MNFSLLASLFGLVLLCGFAGAAEKKEKERESERHEHHEHHELYHGRSFEFHRYEADKMIDYFLKNPVTKRQLECFTSQFRAGDSIDFVIDIAASPSLDKTDRLSAESPVGSYLERFPGYRSASRSYFDFITLFVDIVSYGMKPEMTHTVIVDSGRKFYIPGRYINETIDVSKKQYGADFSDAVRNLKTMWPVSTKSFPESTRMAKILVNNLGRMTKLALWNRDNGLPTVLNGSRRSKAVYSIVLTDGSSGAKIKDLVDDFSRTTVIDIGNHRFVDRLKWDEVRLMPSVFTVSAPQSLLSFCDSVRNMACLLATHHREAAAKSH